MLVRTWNLFHGNAKPPGRDAHLEEMLRLATADDPDVALPAGAPRLERSLARAAGAGCARYVDVAAPPMLGPFPSTAELGRRLTVHHGLLRSALTGQANAILLSREIRVLEHRHARR